MDMCYLSLRHYKTELIWETDGDLHKIYQEDILYLESDGHMITAVTLLWANLPGGLLRQN